MSPRGRRRAALVVAALVSWAAPASAQTGEERTGRLEGRVLDAEHGAPVSAAEVLLLPPTTAGPAGATSAAQTAGTVEDEARALATDETDGSGAYSLRGVPLGSYRIRVRRLGYRTVTVDVHLGREASPRLSVALEVDPILLEPVEVSGRAEAELRDASGQRLAAGRVGATQLRQRRYLNSDSRLISHSDLHQAVTLGETDVFRAMQRLPGVSTRDDYSAELWIRGASWGETRVYLDGLPLFSPLHGFGLLSGMSFRGLGSAVLHPGVHPVASPDGGASVLDLFTRSGMGARAAGGGLDLSLASAQVWGEGPLGSAGAWAVTARRSYADLLASTLADSRDSEFPYAFTDLQGRVDLDLGGGVRLDASALWESDDLSGEIPDVLQRTQARWGNVLAGVGVSFPWRSHRVRVSTGGTQYRARIRAISGQYDDRYNAPSADPADHRVAYLVVRGEIGPPTPGSDTTWSAGIDVTDQTSRYAGPESWPYSLNPPDLPQTKWDVGLVRVGVWGHRRIHVDALTVDGGLRLDGGDATGNARLQLVPSLQARWEVSPRVTISGAVGRSVQYTQSPAPVGPRIQRSLESGRLWILADKRHAPLVARSATLGGEAWLGDAWLVSATAYLRRSTNVLLPDPTPGFILQRLALVDADVRARGLELSLRRLQGRVTGWVGYTVGRARARTSGVTVPAPADRARILDATARVALSSTWSLGLAYTHASGAPFTRVVERCDSASCTSANGVFLDAPYRRRAPGYASLDLLLSWDHRFGRWTAGFFLQGRNLLGHNNGVTYESSALACGDGLFTSDVCPDGSAPYWQDRFQSGIPTVPLLGFRIGF